MTTERSLVLVKPDGYARGLTGEVLRRIEAVRALWQHVFGT